MDSDMTFITRDTPSISMFLQHQFKAHAYLNDDDKIETQINEKMQRTNQIHLQIECIQNCITFAHVV